jgi:hypothetical protein
MKGKFVQRSKFAVLLIIGSIFLACLGMLAETTADILEAGTGD